MTTTRTPFEFPADIFNPGKSNHIEFINTEINIFNRQFNKIKKFDGTLAVPPGVTAGLALWYITSLGPIGFLLFTAASSFASYRSHQQLRPYFEDPYQQQLARLIEVYKWCAKSGTTISSNNAFLELTKKLATFVQAKDLMIWQGKEHWELSDDFKKIILEKDPHFQFEAKKEEPLTLTGQIGQGLLGMFSTVAPAPEKEPVKAPEPKPIQSQKKTETPEENDFKDQIHKLYASGRNLLWKKLYSYKPNYIPMDEKAVETTGLKEEIANYAMKSL